MNAGFKRLELERQLYLIPIRLGFQPFQKARQRATQRCFSGASGLPAGVSTTQSLPILQHHPAL